MRINKRIENLENRAKPNEPRVNTILVDLRSGGGGMEKWDLVTGEVEKTSDQEIIEEWCGGVLSDNDKAPESRAHG